jgi:hypothetical protein
MNHNAAFLDMLARSAEMTAELSEKTTEELMQLRAWQAILYLFFTRYYLDKADAKGSAIADRDLLAGWYRELANDEDGARRIDAIYETLLTTIETCQQQDLAASQAESEEPPEYSH